MTAKKNDTDLLNRVRRHVRNGTYYLVKHAFDRLAERSINLPNVLYVLENGVHEEKKDTFDVKRQVWKYAIRGKTLDGANLRVIVAFEENLIIITVMRIK